jgi:cytochrome c
MALLAAAACAQAVSPAVDPATLAEGERGFQKCYACHSLEGPDPRLQGPSLKGIVGRKVAAEAGFAYSPAMRVYAASQPRWSREALDAFIADPQAAAPGNEMGFFGIRDADERRALIEYLARS